MRLIRLAGSKHFSILQQTSLWFCYKNKIYFFKKSNVFTAEFWDILCKHFFFTCAQHENGSDHKHQPCNSSRITVPFIWGISDALEESGKKKKKKTYYCIFPPCFVDIEYIFVLHICECSLVFVCVFFLVRIYSSRGSWREKNILECLLQAYRGKVLYVSFANIFLICPLLLFYLRPNFSFLIAPHFLPP